MTPIINLKKVYWAQGIIVGLCGLILGFMAPAQVGPFLGGAFLITLNFYLLATLWRRILDKKPVATTIGILVIKYAILGVLLYIFVKEMKVSVIPLFVGLTTLGASFLVVALQTLFSGDSPVGR